MSKLVRTVLEKELNGEYKIDVNATKVLRDATKKAYTGGPRDLSSNDDYLYKT